MSQGNQATSAPDVYRKDELLAALTVPAVALEICVIGLSISSATMLATARTTQPLFGPTVSTIALALLLAVAVASATVVRAGWRSAVRLRDRDRARYRDHREALARAYASPGWARCWIGPPRHRNRLAELREKSGLSLDDLALLLEVSPRTLSLIELEIHEPALAVARMAADLFEEPADRVFWYEIGDPERGEAP